ncbi:hypothetical protein KC19_3G233300 [Ceratodon purpureus]|uniref:Uncharacterized protein n=1 Tax=Ceratodon purpureus TaxID=3225 RepID=A0A8T0ILX0_CERPU|nr:hypothetical protein KC19_3G233300 [Ceratodon purpureus]
MEWAGANHACLQAILGRIFGGTWSRGGREQANLFSRAAPNNPSLCPLQFSLWGLEDNQTRRLPPHCPAPSVLIQNFAALLLPAFSFPSDLRTVEVPGFYTYPTRNGYKCTPILKYLYVLSTAKIQVLHTYCLWVYSQALRWHLRLLFL